MNVVFRYLCSLRSARVSENQRNETLVQFALAQIMRSLTKLALEVHRTSNLSEFPLRVAFARYALCAQAGRRAA